MPLINKLQINNNPAVREYESATSSTLFFTFIINKYKLIDEVNTNCKAY